MDFSNLSYSKGLNLRFPAQGISNWEGTDVGIEGDFDGSVSYGGMLINSGKRNFSAVSAPVFNAPINLPDGIRYFNLFNCANFNSPITFRGSYYVGRGVQINISNCPSFNQPVTFGDPDSGPGSINIRNCKEFNGSISVSGSRYARGAQIVNTVEVNIFNCEKFNNLICSYAISDCSVVDFHIQNCANFNSPVTIPDLNGVAAFADPVSYRFDLKNCVNFNQPVSLNLNISGELSYATVDFNNAFLGCEKLSQPVGINMTLSGNHSVHPNLTSAFRNCYNIQSLDINIQSNMSGDSNIYLNYLSYRALNNAEYVNITTHSESLTNINLAGAFMEETQFNGDVNINISGNYKLNVYALFINCTEFNHPITSLCNSLSGMKSGINNQVYWENMFYNDRKFNQNFLVECTNLDIVNTINLARMFHNCIEFDSEVSIDFGTFSTTPNVTLDRMFSNCVSLDSNVAVSINSVNNAVCSAMFINCSTLNSAVSVNLTASGVVNCDSMFAYCNKFNQPFIIPENTVNTSYMFNNCFEFDQPVDIPDTVVNCAGMFANCKNFDQSISIPYGVTNCADMFKLCSNFSQSITVPDGANFHEILGGCSNFKGTISIPSADREYAPFNTGLAATQNTLGATIHVRDSGKVIKVISYTSVYGVELYKWSDRNNT